MLAAWLAATWVTSPRPPLPPPVEVICHCGGEGHAGPHEAALPSGGPSLGAFWGAGLLAAGFACGLGCGGSGAFLVYACLRGRGREPTRLRLEGPRADRALEAYLR